MSKMKDYLSQVSVDIGKCGVIDAEVMMVALNQQAAEDSVAEFWAKRCLQFDVVYPFDMRVDELNAIGFEDSCSGNDDKPSLMLERAGCRIQVWYGFDWSGSELYMNDSYTLSAGANPACPDYIELTDYIEFSHFDELMEYIQAYLQKHGGLDD